MIKITIYVQTLLTEQLGSQNMFQKVIKTFLKKINLKSKQKNLKSKKKNIKNK